MFKMQLLEAGIVVKQLEPTSFSFPSRCLGRPGRTTDLAVRSLVEWLIVWKINSYSYFLSLSSIDGCVCVLLWFPNRKFFQECNYHSFMEANKCSKNSTKSLLLLNAVVTWIKNTSKHLPYSFIMIEDRIAIPQCFNHALPQLNCFSHRFSYHDLVFCVENYFSIR